MKRVSRYAFSLLAVLAVISLAPLLFAFHIHSPLSSCLFWSFLLHAHFLSFLFSYSFLSLIAFFSSAIFATRFAIFSSFLALSLLCVDASLSCMTSLMWLFIDQQALRTWSERAFLLHLYPHCRVSCLLCVTLCPGHEPLSVFDGCFLLSSCSRVGSHSFSLLSHFFLTSFCRLDSLSSSLDPCFLCLFHTCRVQHSSLSHMRTTLSLACSLFFFFWSFFSFFHSLSRVHALVSM